MNRVLMLMILLVMGGLVTGSFVSASGHGGHGGHGGHRGGGGSGGWSAPPSPCSPANPSACYPCPADPWTIPNHAACYWPWGH
ncbi:MAG: hypothetical protein ABSD41_05460 [Candidatus Bathyarchaeia archaeon]